MGEVSGAVRAISSLVASSLLLGILITVPLVPRASAEARASRTSNETADSLASLGLHLAMTSVSQTRLAALNVSVNSGGATSASTISNVLVIAPIMFGGQSWDLGDGVYHSTAGTTNFTTSSDPDFPAAASLLTDGTNGSIQLDTWWPGGGGSEIGAPESYWLHGNPDLIGYRVDFIRLAIHDLNIYTVNGGTQVFENYTWEIWGVRIFVAFYPPTDPNGTYLIDRRYSNINVSLEEPGTAVLNWNGTNRTMVGSSTSWRLNVSGLANGVYAYRVWATNASGIVFGSELRYLMVGKGVWSVTHIAYGFLPSVTFDASGNPHVCFYGGDLGSMTGLVYGTHNASGWHFASLEGTSGDTGESCSIGLDRLSMDDGIGRTADGTFYVKYASFNGTAWTRETVDSGFDTLTSIAINPVDNQPMIAYSDVPGGGIKLASHAGGTWSIQAVDASFYGWAFSLVIDSTGSPRIAYANIDPFVLKYAQWTAPRWSTSVVDCCAYAPSLKLDSSGIPHVAYLTDSGVKYASFSGTAWTNATVDVKSFSSVSLALDSQDRAHVAYAMQWGGDVRYAVQNGTWNIHVVSHNFGGNGLAMALQSSGEAGVVFPTNLSSGDLVYATNMKDTAPPSTTARLAGTLGAFGWYRSAVQVTLVATDDLSVLNTTYRVDGGPWQGYSGPFTVPGDGNHTIEYFSTDYAENVEATRTTSMRIDSTPPTVQVLATGTIGQADWYRSAVTIALVASDATSGVGLVTYRVDASSWQNYSGPFVVADQGPHFVFYSAEDLAGNIAAIGIFSPMIDSVAPSSSISVSGTSGTGGWYTSAADVDLRAADGVSGVAFISYRIDGGAWNTFSGPVRLSDGIHAVEYRSTDRAGNVEANRTATVDVDTVAPLLSNLTPAGPLTTSVVTVSWTGADATSGVARYEIRVDGGAYVDVGLATRTSLTLSDGRHRIELRAVDAAGNRASGSTVVQVDTNVFSPSGPYHVLPLYSVVAVMGAVAFLLLWRRRRKGRGSPRFFRPRS